jgi:hypothetical protein
MTAHLDIDLLSPFSFFQHFQQSYKPTPTVLSAESDDVESKSSNI